MDGELRRGDDSLIRIASGSAEGSINNGSFAYDEATMRSIINDWLEIGDDYDKSLQDSQPVTKVEPPGLDYASKAQAEAANASGRAYIAYLQHNRDYCYEQAQLCQNTLDDYLGVEHRNVREINKSGEPTEDGSGPVV